MADPFVLNEASISNEASLLEYLSQLDKSIEGATDETLQSRQSDIESSLLKVVCPPTVAQNATPALPKPGRPARHLAARSFNTLFSRAETRSLFDVLQKLVKPMADPKADRETRIACFYTGGEIMHIHGSQVMSMFAEITATCTKVIRTSSTAIIVRHAALVCLRKSLISGGRSMGDAAGRDMLKVLKNTLSDKSSVIQRAGAMCISTLFERVTFGATFSDHEAVMQQVCKAADSADFSTRRDFVSLVAGLLAATQIEGTAAPPPEPTKKKGKDKEEEDDTYSAPKPTSTEIPRTLLSLNDMLAHLSVPYNKANSSKRLRNCIIDMYATLFTYLGINFVETHYELILKHLVTEIGSPARTITNRHEALLARKSVKILLRDVVGVRTLSEQGQFLALREIANNYLIKWPAVMPGEVAPKKQVLVIVLDEAAGLLDQLGNASQPIQQSIFDPLLRITAHPSHSVQISAALCLRSFCAAAPSRLSSTISQLIELLNKDLSMLADSSPPADLNRRTVGHAHALASLVSLIPHRSLYVSIDVSTKVMSLAIHLLKQSGNHELHISGVEIQVAWILVGALMSLGPNFVRLHLPQLLILWKNALPKPTSKDMSAAQVRTENEWAFLLHIRECTLSAIYTFLQHNANKLVTVDVGKRLAALLSNGLAFLTSFASQNAQLLAEQAPSNSSALRLADREAMMRRRLLQCFVALGQSQATEVLQSSLLSTAISTFADPERYTGSVVQAAIAASAGSFTSIWDAAEFSGYGVTSMISEEGTSLGKRRKEKKQEWLNRDSVEAAIEALLRTPIFTAAEHDALILASYNSINEKPPASTGVVDAAIELFTLYLPLQEPNGQSAATQSLFAFVQSNKTEKNPGRKMAILANASTAIVGYLRVAAQKYKNLELPQGVCKGMQEILKDSIIHEDARIRLIGSEALGRLCQIGGTGFMTAQIQACVTQVVSSTDPASRAGCALTFGEIYKQVGGLSAGPALKTIVDVLMSLAADPHPLVHFWSLVALEKVIIAASLSYEPYVNSTIGMLAKLYMQESHEPEGGVQNISSYRSDLPAFQAFCKITNAVIGVLGPELQESDRVRSLILILLEEFLHEADEGVAVEAIKAMQHLLIFAPDAIPLPRLIEILRIQLSSSRRPLKVAAINSVYQLVQRDATAMSKLGGDKFVQELFGLLDDDPTIEGVRDTILSWLQQTAVTGASGWIDLCQRIMSRSTATKAVVDQQTGGFGGFTDEESQGLGLEAESGGPSIGNQKRTTSRWRTQLFALQCLHQVFVTVARSGHNEHFDPVLARGMRLNKRTLLVSRVADLIKMAFTASTASVMEIRLEGLVVLQDVIENFSKSPDADFESALLLEQFQAPTAAALTPAFSSDSYPEVLAAAIRVCAVFVGSGVVKEINNMGRILKLLVGALESCREQDMTTVGGVHDLSTTAAIMLKASIFAAWADFQTLSVDQNYLVDVIKPYLPLLCPFWVASLREYAKMKADNETAGQGPTSMSGAFDSAYSGLTREIALPYYENAWPQMLHAVATLLASQNPVMVAAMDGVDISPEGKISTSNKKAADPALYFWIVFGLAFESLSLSAMSGDTRPAAIQTSKVGLAALQGLANPAVCGNSFTDDGIFNEVWLLYYRLAVSMDATVKSEVVAAVLQLAHALATPSFANGATERSLEPDDRLTKCMRLITFVLQQSVPAPNSDIVLRVRKTDAPAHIQLLKNVFAAFLDMADLFESSTKLDLYSIAFFFYSQLLRDETAEVDLISPTLPILKGICDCGFKISLLDDNQTLTKVVNALLSSCLTNVDNLRGRSGDAAKINVKGNILAATLLMTAIPVTVQLSQAAIEHCCFAISQLVMSNEAEISSTAIYCTKSLISASARGSAALQHCVSQLLPNLVDFVDEAAVSDHEQDQPAVQRLQEVLKAFTSFLAIVPADQRKLALDFIIPTFAILLNPDATPLAPFHQAAVKELISLASSNSVAFKQSTSELEETVKSKLETSIMQSMGGRSAAQSSASAAPSISLKSFG